ncbi:MAG: hypothetical protein MUF84_18530 [Anaerolineae bacterium]|nr:hypothetical protein [Anaerolineae bacterium]
MDHLHRTRRSRFSVLIGVLVLVWGGAGHVVALAADEGPQMRALRSARIASPDDEPPSTELVPGDEEARNAERLPDAAWVGIVLLLSTGGFALGRILPRRPKEDRASEVKRLWRDEAETTLPEPERPWLWACKVKVSPDVRRGWGISRIALVPLPLSAALNIEPKVVDDPKLLVPLNDLEALAAAVGRDSVVGDRLALLTHALVSRVMAWSQEGCPPAAFRVDAEMSSPISGHYELYQSRAARSRLTAALGQFLGPKATELDYPGRLRAELGACLLAFVRMVRWME